MIRLLSSLVALCLLAACQHSGPRMERVAISPSADADPWENTNRRIHRFNDGVDRLLLKPSVGAYRSVVPAAPRRGVANIYDTLQEPTNFANAVAQGKIKSGFRALDRILINGGLGLALADHASAMGLDEQPHDFGQTLAVWGVPSGPFVMLPFLGPNTARDSVGFFVDFFFDPVDYLENRLLSPQEQILELGLKLADLRSGITEQGEQLLTGSADPYATIRSAWLQLRRYQLFDGQLPADAEDEEDLPPPPPLPETEETP